LARVERRDHAERGDAHQRVGILQQRPGAGSVAGVA
jgi:hypothetical protein